MKGAIAQLSDLSRDELVARWKKAFGHPPPRGIKRGLIELGVAWRGQARELGGHSPSVNRLLKKLTAERQAGWSDSSLRHTGDPTKCDVIGKTRVRSGAQRTSPASAAPPLSPGTRLVREWHGTSHHVDVLEEGFVFEGKVFESLSAIAREITGAHWSGPRFFGLTSLGKGDAR